MTLRQTSGGGKIAYKWWAGSSRATLARLRRAATPVDVMLTPEALRLVTMLPHSPKDRVAILAGVLAWVREADEKRVARAIGRAALDDDQSALMSEARFRRLLQSKPAELLDPMRRLVRQMKGRANVEDLADAILFWGDKVKRKWIFDYYSVATSAPSVETATEKTPTLQQDSIND